MGQALMTSVAQPAIAYSSLLPENAERTKYLDLDEA